MVKYTEGLFTLLAERSRLVRHIIRDGRVIDPQNLLSQNQEILGRVQGLYVFDELLKGIAETMPEFSLAYKLSEPQDTNLSSGFPIRRAIEVARAARSPNFKELNHFRTYSFTLEIDRKLKEYFDYIEDQSASSRKLLETLETDNTYMRDLVGLVKKFTFEFVEIFQHFPYREDIKYTGNVPDSAVRLFGNIGKIPVPAERIKRFNLDLLSRVLYPHPEYGFATGEDSWRLFRDNFLGEAHNHFALVKSTSQGFHLYVEDHRQTNGLGKIIDLNQNPSAPRLVFESLEKALDYYQKISSGSGLPISISVFGVPHDEYDSKRVSFYRQILKNFGELSTIKSMHGDESLLFTRQTLPAGDFAYQNVSYTNVSRQLRKLVTLSRIMGGFDRPISEVYPSIAPIIRNYKKQVFEQNIGTVVSDLSGSEHARNWLATPTYLAPGKNPFIVVSPPFFHSNGENFDVSIAVRSTTDSSRIAAERSVYETFRGASRVYPR